MDTQLQNFVFDDLFFVNAYKRGWITHKFFSQREIYMWVDAQVKLRKITRYKAALEAEVKFGKGIATIFRALKAFEEQVI